MLSFSITDVGDVDENANAHKRDKNPAIAAIDSNVAGNKIVQTNENIDIVDETEQETEENPYNDKDNSPGSNDFNNTRKPTQESGISSPSECVASGNA